MITRRSGSKIGPESVSIEDNRGKNGDQEQKQSRISELHFSSI